MIIFHSNLTFFKTCSITICPADEDCIATSYADQRAIDNDSCDEAEPGFQANIGTANGNIARRK